MSIDALGAIYGVHRATAARWLKDVNGRLFAAVQERFAIDLKVSASAFASLLTAVRPELRATLNRLLAAPSAPARR